MSIVRTALPLILLTSVLTGCAGLQKTDWPTCAAVGGVVGAATGAPITAILLVFELTNDYALMAPLMLVTILLLLMLQLKDFSRMWMVLLTAPLGLSCPVWPAKGYSATFRLRDPDAAPMVSLGSTSVS